MSRVLFFIRLLIFVSVMIYWFLTKSYKIRRVIKIFWLIKPISLSLNANEDLSNHK